MRSTLIAAIVLAAGSCAMAAPDPVAPPDRPAEGKIIEFGWQTPTPQFVYDNIKQLEEFPFDGLVLTLYANDKHDASEQVNRKAAFSNRIFDAARLAREDYTESIEFIKTTPFKRFTDNFIRADAQPGKLDWFDDNCAAAIENMRTLAQIAKDTGVKGIFFDTESYDGQPFNIAQQPQHDRHTGAEYEQQAKRRGSEIMSAMSEAYPEITIIVTRGYSMAHGEDAQNNEKYGLLPWFLDGMNDAAGPGSVLCDGGENAYNFRTEAQFADTRKAVRETALQWSSTADKLREHWRCAFGIWIDYGDTRWDTRDFTKNFFTPQEFAFSLHQALRHSDRYVWIYAHNADWWHGRVPQQYIDALEKARKPHVDAPQRRDTVK